LEKLKVGWVVKDEPGKEEELGEEKHIESNLNI
jgi:hypothetical protein